MIHTSYMHAHIFTYLRMHTHTHRQNRQAQKEVIKQKCNLLVHLKISFSIWNVKTVLAFHTLI